MPRRDRSPPLARLEGASILIGAIWHYVGLGEPIAHAFLLYLLPEVTLVALLVCSRETAVRAYQAAHTLTTPLVLGAVATFADLRVVYIAAVVWAAHIGMERALDVRRRPADGARDATGESEVLPRPILLLVRRAPRLGPIDFN